jgi:hypothetical protein
MSIDVTELAAPAQLLPPPVDDTACRALYTRALDPEGLFTKGRFIDDIRAELHRLHMPETEGQSLDELRLGAAAWSADESARYLALTPAASDAADVQAERAMLACAPLATQAGAWLQWMSAPGNAEDSDMLSVLALYASDVGVGRANASRGSVYVALLREAGLAGYAVPTARLALDQRIADRDFYLPAVLLAMSRHPEEFRPEILGADAFLRVVGLLPALVVAAGAAGWADRLRSAAPDAAWEPVWAALRANDQVADRVAAGFRWAWGALRRWSADLYADLRAARDPAYAMAELMAKRSREGAAYHAGFQLGGCPFAELLRNCRRDPDALLTALAASRLVRPGNAKASPLINGLVAEPGPMFRVFSPADISVIGRWIDSLPAAEPTRHTRRPRSYPVPSAAVTAATTGSTRGDRAPADLRSAYRMLLGRRDTPRLRQYAYDYAHTWLARARHGLDDAPGQLPRRWTPEGLRPWLLDQHDQHDQRFSSDDAEVISREELIDSTVQLAPLTLIDGAWLQGFTDYAHAGSEHGYFLFETYFDELGNGVPKLNHPLIYRAVLGEMGVRLPATDSAEFAHWPGFRNSSFALPVYWLSIGRQPQTFLPEIFGLNLAMELSGVGGSYRRARIDLKHHGFSTRFVDIHNTVDNVATGHSAWAADAIDAYMSAILVAQGAEAQAAVWERIRAGFRSLNPPADFWARRAARRVNRSGAVRRAPVRRHGYRDEGVAA